MPISKKGGTNLDNVILPAGLLLAEKTIRMLDDSIKKSKQKKSSNNTKPTQSKSKMHKLLELKR
jgi:hypothetical protein